MIQHQPTSPARLSNEELADALNDARTALHRAAPARHEHYTVFLEHVRALQAEQLARARARE